MNKPLKIALIVASALAALALVTAIVVGTNLDRIVRRLIISTGSQMLGTRVELRQVKLALTEGSGGLYALAIANPAGFSAAHALELDEISLRLEVASVATDEIVIERIVIDGARVLFEEKGGTTNLKTLADRLVGEPSGPSAPASQKEGPRLVIRELRFTNAQVRIVSEKLAGGTTFPLPDLVLKDIGRKGAGVTTAEATRQILAPLMRKAIEAAGRKLLENELGRGLRGLLNKARGE